MKRSFLLFSGGGGSEEGARGLMHEGKRAGGLRSGRNPLLDVWVDASAQGSTLHGCLQAVLDVSVPTCTTGGSFLSDSCKVEIQCHACAFGSCACRSPRMRFCSLRKFAKRSQRYACVQNRSPSPWEASMDAWLGRNWDRVLPRRRRRAPYDRFHRRGRAWSRTLRPS